MRKLATELSQPSNGIIVNIGNLSGERIHQPIKIYVIFRVFNINSPNVGLKIYVEPLRFQGGLIDFEALGWGGKTKNSSARAFLG